jgi:glycosyltransferase involved in cell wall biosynthesis
VRDGDEGQQHGDSSGAALTAAAGLLHVVVSTQRRGAEVFATDLAHDLRRRGIASDVVALTAGTERVPLPVRVLGRSELGPATLLALRREANGSSAAVAHGSRTLVACAAALAATGVPFVYRSIGDPGAWSTRGVRRFRTTLLLRRARLVTVLWDGAADVLMAHHGVPSAKIRVVPNGVAAERCPVPDAVDKVGARLHLGLPADARVVAYIGSLTGEKRVDHAITAVGRLQGVHLVVAGHGPGRAALEAQAARDAPSRVRFVGALSDVAPVYAAADAVVLASRTEGMPGVLIEAGLSERPVVAYDVGAVSQVIADGETGVLVTSGDVSALAAALRRVLEDPGTMGAGARRRCLARFEIGVVGERWAEVVGELAAG